MQIDSKTIEAIIGAKIQAEDIQLQTFPFSKYNQGARDALVNLLKALRVDIFIKNQPDKSEPIDKTKA
jgi:hypothetical protein